MNARSLLIAYALVNAVLYSVLLPLWEGFDEPFHFAFVQQLANGQGLPDPRTDRLSREVFASLLLAPASDVVKQNMPQVTSYATYFSWPAPMRSEMRARLWEVPAALRWQPAEVLNYEAHQPPLAYILLAIPERLLASVPLPLRVAILRIAAAVTGSLLLLAGAAELLTQLRLPDSYQIAALFCLLSCQMIWAALAHVGNDWLAVPLAVWILVAINRLESRPDGRTAATAALILAVGLLTKAWFLAFVPLLLGLCLLRRRWKELMIASLILGALAGPWYARNVIRYGVLTATQEARGGVNLPAVLRAAPTLNWPVVIASSVRASLWTGNNTFLAFSANTLNLIIGLCLLALLLWAASRHSGAEWITLSYCALFGLALGYAAIASHIYTHGAANGPSPWYAQVLVAPLLGLAMLGASRWPRPGMYLSSLLVVLFGYVLAATYAVKLIPFYGGYEGRTSLGELTALYGHRLSVLAAGLNTTALAPAAVIFALSGATILLAVLQQISIVRALLQRS